MKSNGMCSLKRQIFLVLGLFFSFSSLGAMCPQTVGGVTPGEAIWKLMSRIGEASNVIQSQICSIDLVASSTTSIDCTFVFGQTDIGVGGVYTISAPGTYCLSENVSFNTGSAITVSSDNVTIELEGHTMNGGGNSCTAIELAGGIQNVIIQNGIIENIGGASPNGIAIRDTVGHSSTIQNITIQDLSFNNNSVAAISLDQASAGTFDVEGLLIQNCEAYNSGQILVQGFSGIVQNCNVYENRGDSIFSGITAQGASGSLYADDFIIQDCITTSSAGSNNVPIQILNTRNATIRNSIIQGSSLALSPTNYGIAIRGYNNGVISDCVAQESAYYGITANDPQGGSLVIERCLSVRAAGPGFEVDNPAVDMPVSVIDCVAQQCGIYGFLIFNNGLGTFADVNINNCSACSNATSGFAVAFDTGPSIIRNIAFENCFAQLNSQHGFLVVAGNSFGTPDVNAVANVVFRNCMSQRNGLDGFGIGVDDVFFANTGAITGVICENCVAQDNANGFNFGFTTTLGKIIDCCSMNNTVTGISNQPGFTNAVIGNASFSNVFEDITGVSDPSLLVSRSLAGALAGATRWVNAVS